MVVQNARSSAEGVTNATELDTTDMDEYFNQVETIVHGEEETEEAAESAAESTSEETAESTSEEAAD